MMRSRHHSRVGDDSKVSVDSVHGSSEYVGLDTRRTHRNGDASTDRGTGTVDGAGIGAGTVAGAAGVLVRSCSRGGSAVNVSHMMKSVKSL